MAVARKDRKSAIQELVRANSIRTQSELVELLKERGFDATQATVSRDMADLGLEKEAGIYSLPQDKHLRNLIHAQMTETRRAGNQLVVLTKPGSAQMVAAAIDAAQPVGVLGSIAGDDTILVIAADEANAKRFQLELDRLI